MPKKVRESSLLRYALFNVKLSINSAVWETTHPIKGHIYVDILNENPAPKLGPNIRNRPTTQIYFFEIEIIHKPHGHERGERSKSKH